MKKDIILILFCLLLLGIFPSCKNGILGDGTDTIGLETREVFFDSGKNETELKTEKGDSWWLSQVVAADGSLYNWDSVKENRITTKCGLYVEKTMRKSVIIGVGPNPTKTARRFKVALQDGNYFNTIFINQEASKKNISDSKK